MANVKRMFSKTLAVILAIVMVISMMSTAFAAPGWGGGWGGGYVLDERYFDGDRYFGWDTYSRNATLRDEKGRDVYSMITVTVGDEELDKGDTERSVSNQDVVDHGVTISNIPAGYYISAYKIVCEKYACYTDQAGNATDEKVSLDAGQGSYHVSVTKADMGHANTGAKAYYILIELSAFKIEDEEIVTYPYNVFYNYGELADELAGEPATTDPNTYIYNSSATILSPNASAVAAAKELGYKFVGWEIESVEGILAITSVIGTKLLPGALMTVTGETTLKALWEKIPVPAVTVDKTADGETYKVGDIVTWTITVTNTGEYTAYDVVVTDAIPAGLKLVEGEAVTTIAELAPGASETITVKTEVVEAGIHTNTASASWKNVDGDSFGGDPEGDTVTVEEPEAPVVVVDKAADGETYKVGDIVTWTITVTNTSEHTAYNVVVTDNIPAGLKLVEGETVTVIAELAPGASETVTVKTEVIADGIHTNTAFATWENVDGEGTEGDPSGDTVTAEKLKLYTLTVNYVDTEGNELADPIVTADLVEGSEYTTEEKTFEGYTFVETRGDAVSGVMDDHKEVTYVYTLNEYTLTVNYVDTEGNELADSIVTEGLTHGEEYTTEEKSFEGYTFVETRGDAVTGIMDGDKEVTYVYTLSEYTLVVNYVDTEGNELADSIVEGKTHGEEYTTEEKSFEGYTFVETRGDAVTGIMDGDKEVTYVYEKNPNLYTLTVNYVDTEGNELADSVVTTDLVEGSEYTTEEKTFEGYTFVETRGDAVTGIMDGDKEVTYVYEKEVPPPPPAPETYTLTVKYVDAEGNALADTLVILGMAEGIPYTTEQLVIEGYEFLEIRGDAPSGTMDSDKEVIYVYSVAAPPVVPPNPPVIPPNPPVVPPIIPPIPPADVPEDPEPPIDILDDEVPLTDIPDEEVPKTGDPSLLLAAAFVVSGAGLGGLVIRRRKDEE